MRLTKYEHACVLVEDRDARILIDPGGYSRGFEGLDGLTAVLLTHQHADHVDADRLRRLLDRNPGAQVYGDAGTARLLHDSGVAVTTVRAGDRLEPGTPVVAFGAEHAVVHADLPRVPNVGYLVGGRFFHPGDALTIPDVPVEILAVPTGGPWLKLAEAVDYLRAVAPRVAVPIHEATLARPAGHYGYLDQLAPAGMTLSVIEPGTAKAL